MKMDCSFLLSSVPILYSPDINQNSQENKVNTCYLATNRPMTKPKLVCGLQERSNYNYDSISDGFVKV